MTGMQMMLSALGIKISESDIKAVEEIIPKLPGFIANATKVVNERLANFDQRLQTLEANQKIILEAIQHGGYNPGGTKRVADRVTNRPAANGGNRNTRTNGGVD